MVYVLSIFAIGLAYAAWQARAPGTRLALAIVCVLNIGCAIKMVHDGYPYAFRLEPQRTAPGLNDDPKPWIP